MIDYTKDDFTTRTGAYDVIMDNVGNRPFSACRRVLSPNGRYVLVGGGGPDDRRILGPLGRVASIYVQAPFVDQQMGMFIARAESPRLEWFAEAMGTGAVSRRSSTGATPSRKPPRRCAISSRAAPAARSS